MAKSKTKSKAKFIATIRYQCKSTIRARHKLRSTIRARRMLKSTVRARSETAGRWTNQDEARVAAKAEEKVEVEAEGNEVQLHQEQQV